MLRNSDHSSTKTFYDGQRLSFEGALCTVRYFGPLDGTKGQWLGVEWDEPNRGKHAGTHQGKPIFQCLSTSSTAASFVRPSRSPDSKRTFLEAIRFKYGDASSDHLLNGSAMKQEAPQSSANPSIEISGKEVEEIGFDRIRKQQAALENLKIVVIDGLTVAGSVHSGDLSAEGLSEEENIARHCPNIVELDLGWNLFETLEEVGNICRFLYKLRTLRLNGSRFRSLELPSAEGSPSPFQNVKELYLSECLLTTVQVLQLIEQLHLYFPCLETLALSSNNLSCFPDPLSSSDLKPSRSVTTLILENNILKSLEDLSAIQKALPNLQTLSLQGNSVSEIGVSSRSDRPLSSFSPDLETLDLSRNQIADYAFIDKLPTILPLLQSLRVSSNPLYALPVISANNTQAKPSDAPFFLTLARIPTLKTLNYTNITPRDREEGEIYYLSVAEKDIAPLLQAAGTGPASIAEVAEAATERYPRYVELCGIYERDSIITKALSKPTTSEIEPPDASAHAPGSLGARLIKTTFHTPTTSQTLSLPRTLDVYRLKALLSRTLHLPPLQFKLVYESPELDPLREYIDPWTSWDEWGDWDVDGDLDDAAETAAGLGPDVQGTGREKWVDGVLYKDGGRWKRREIELVDGFREWGFLLEEGVSEARVRVEMLQVGKK